MAALRERQKLEVRNSLLNNGLDLFRRRGVESTTIEEITQAAGVAKGTFFNHFPSKDALLYDFMQAETDRRIEAAIAAGRGGAQAALQAIVAALGRFGHENRQLLLDLGNLKGSLRERERDHDDGIRRRLTRLIEEDEGIDPVWRRSMSARFAGLVLATLSGTVHEWRLRAGEPDLRRLMSERIEMLLVLLPGNARVTNPDESE